MNKKFFFFTHIFSVLFISFTFSQTNEWIIYDPDNSNLPSRSVWAITEDNNGNKWLGTAFGGAVVFDGENWTIYNLNNSDIPSDVVNALVIDNEGDKWFATAWVGKI